MQLTKEDLIEFQQITNCDISAFLTHAISFFTVSYPALVQFYSGQSKEIDRGVYTQLEQLSNERDSIYNVYNEFRSALNNLKWWILLEYVEEIDNRVNTARNINRWSKSSLTSVAYDPAIQLEYTMKPKQTLERIASDVLGKVNSDEWVDLALDNHLREEDYTPSGGTVLELSFPRINNGVQITSVVDTMVGKNIYGKDIDRVFAFDTTSEDIRVLSPDDTIQQSVDILANLKKNENPDFPTDGLQQTIVIGANKAALNFPVIDRQMSETFSTDDSLKDFALQSIQIDQDALIISFIVFTRLNEVIEQNILV